MTVNEQKAHIPHPPPYFKPEFFAAPPDGHILEHDPTAVTDEQRAAIATAFATIGMVPEDATHSIDPRNPLVRCLRHLEWEAHQRGWSRADSYAPRLFWLTGRIDAERPDATRYRARPMNVPGWLWHSDHRPVAILQQLPAALDASPPEAIPHSLVGVAFQTEAWSITTDDPKLKGALDVAAVRGISQHPDRQEMRLLHGAALDGTTAHVIRVRDRQPKAEGLAAGDIICALAAIVAKLHEIAKRE